VAYADSGIRVVQGVGLPSLYYWNRGFKARWGHVYCIAAISVTSRSLVQRSSTVCVTNRIWSRNA